VTDWPGTAVPSPTIEHGENSLLSEEFDRESTWGDENRVSKAASRRSVLTAKQRWQTIEKNAFNQRTPAFSEPSIARKIEAGVYHDCRQIG
jgi:hypothetical protein